jgi:hypothetical protein
MDRELARAAGLELNLDLDLGALLAAISPGLRECSV